MSTVGIDTLKAGIALFADIVVAGIRLVKMAPAIVTEVRDIQVDEGIMVVVDVATVQAPKVIEALKS
jgi:hypothetical protein